MNRFFAIAGVSALTLFSSVPAQQAVSLSTDPSSTLTAEVPHRLTAQLTSSSGALLPGLPIVFESRDSLGTWTVIEDGLTATSQTTRQIDGIADVMFVPDRTLSVDVRIRFPGNDSLQSAESLVTYPVELNTGSFQEIGDFRHTKGDGIPLILVHGRSAPGPFERWQTYLDYIQANPAQFAEYDVYLWDHDTDKPIGFNGTSGSAQDLYDSLAQISGLYSEFTPVFLAHSRGGLVVRSLMGRVESDGTRYGDRVLGLVTLGTPHHGSPLAVADWASEIWKQSTGNTEFSDSTFSLLVGENGLMFETDLLGDLNLAWDNYDGAITQQGFRTSGETNVIDVSPADLNTETLVENDVSLIYGQPWKTRFGTLASLNSESNGTLPFAEKIVAIGAYRSEPSNLLLNLVAAVEIVLSLPISTNVRDWLDIQLDDGDIERNLLSIGNRLLAHSLPDLFDNASDINYDANDGLVPLQSALLLKPALGNISDATPVREVNLNRSRVAQARQVKAHHIFTTTEGIENHLDLLVTDNEQYWATLTQELRLFLPAASANSCAPDLDSTGKIDFADFLLFAQMFADQDPQADFNIDGTTDFNDFLIFASKFGQPCP